MFCFELFFLMCFCLETSEELHYSKDSKEFSRLCPTYFMPLTKAFEILSRELFFFQKMFFRRKLKRLGPEKKPLSAPVVSFNKKNASHFFFNIFTESLGP